MAEMMTLRLRLPLWRRTVVWFWIRALAVKEVLFPGSVDESREAERMARFVCRVEFDG